MPFTPWEMAFVAVYVLSLLVIGWLGLRARKDDSMQDYYLAGRGIGFLVLLLTLYATQYSGNTLFGFTGKAYEQGFSWGVSIHFMTAIVVFYLLFAPKLHRLARRRDFITPTDFLNDRFRSREINIVSTVIMISALANFLLAQLKAMGEALRGFVPEHPDAAYVYGVIILALIIVVYETIGGFRAVAWTDVIQGSVLIVGFVVLMVLMFDHFGSLEQATKLLQKEAPEKVAPPTGDGARTWLSWILLVGIGGALYPQAIQRIYAARRGASLRRSLAVMAFMPLTTTLIALLFGVMAAAHIPAADSAIGPAASQGTGNDTSRADSIKANNKPSDNILTVVCRQIQQRSMLGRWVVVVLFAAILAALMSTADSVLLSISSMATKDIYAGVFRPHASQHELTRVGKICSWLLIGAATLVAIALKDTDLVTLLKVKFEILIQLAPAIIIGINWKGMQSVPTLLGILVGVAVSLALLTFIGARIWGMHAGILGLAANVVVAVGGSLIAPPQPANLTDSV